MLVSCKAGEACKREDCKNMNACKPKEGEACKLEGWSKFESFSCMK